MIPPEFLGIPPEALSGLDPNQNPLMSLQFQASHKQMPATFNLNSMPHADFLEGYDKVLDNGAERIFQAILQRQNMIFAQTQHRHAMEIREQDRLDKAQETNRAALDLDKIEVEGRLKLSSRGQIFGLGLAIAVIVVGFTLAVLGRTNEACALFISGIFTVFVTGKPSWISESLKKRFSEKHQLPKGGAGETKKPDTPPHSESSQLV